MTLVRAARMHDEQDGALDCAGTNASLSEHTVRAARPPITSESRPEKALSDLPPVSVDVMTVTTQGGAVYSIEYRDLDGAGRRLAEMRHGGPDDPPETNKPMAEDEWYRVAVLTPLPPEIGTKVRMILDPVEGDADPIVRQSTMVMSVVGIL